MPGMMSCKKATELAEKRPIAGLTIGERLGLKFHLMICKSCMEYHRQSQRIENFLRSMKEQKKYSTMNSELKDRIKQRLNQESTR